MSDVWTVSASGEREGSRSPCFSKSFNDWEMDEVERLLFCLGGKKVNLDEKDRVRWLESKDGNFSVKSLYKALESDSSVSFLWKIIWKSRVQPKNKLLCLGSIMGKSSNFGPNSKEGMGLSK